MIMPDPDDAREMEIADAMNSIAGEVNGNEDLKKEVARLREARDHLDSQNRTLLQQLNESMAGAAKLAEANQDLIVNNTALECEKDKLESSASAMRKVLTDCLYDRSDHTEPDELDEAIIKATSTDAGKSFLARLQKAEAERDAARNDFDRLVQKGECGWYDDQLKIITRLEQERSSFASQLTELRGCYERLMQTADSERRSRLTLSSRLGHALRFIIKDRDFPVDRYKLDQYIDQNKDATDWHSPQEYTSLANEKSDIERLRDDLAKKLLERQHEVVALESVLDEAVKALEQRPNYVVFTSSCQCSRCKFELIVRKVIDSCRAARGGKA